MFRNRQWIILFAIATLGPFASVQTTRAQDRQPYGFGIRFNNVQFRPQNFTGFSFQGQTRPTGNQTPIQFRPISFPSINGPLILRNRGIESIPNRQPFQIVFRERNRPFAPEQFDAPTNSTRLANSNLPRRPVSTARLSRRAPFAAANNGRIANSQISSPTRLSVNNARQLQTSTTSSSNRLARSRRPYSSSSRQIAVARNQSRQIVRSNSARDVVTSQARTNRNQNRAAIEAAPNRNANRRNDPFVGTVIR